MNRQFPGRNFHPLVSCALVAHQHVVPVARRGHIPSFQYFSILLESKSKFLSVSVIALWAKDIELLKSFYEKYFGAQAGPKYVNAKKRFFSYFLTFSSGARLELMQMPEIQKSKADPAMQFSDYAHIAFSVGSRDKVDALTLQLARDGFTVFDGPRKTGDGYYESVVSDPEGNRLEITI